MNQKEKLIHLNQQPRLIAWNFQALYAMYNLDSNLEYLELSNTILLPMIITQLTNYPVMKTHLPKTPIRQSCWNFYSFDNKPRFLLQFFTCNTVLSFFSQNERSAVYYILKIKTPETSKCYISIQSSIGPHLKSNEKWQHSQKAHLPQSNDEVSSPENKTSLGFSNKFIRFCNLV